VGNGVHRGPERHPDEAERERGEGSTGQSPKGRAVDRQASGSGADPSRAATP
jgi:hypothetical protein